MARGSSGAQGVRADSRALSLCYAFSFFSTTVCQEGRRIVDESSLEKHLEDGTSCRRGGKREREGFVDNVAKLWFKDKSGEYREKCGETRRCRAAIRRRETNGMTKAPGLERLGTFSI